MVKGHFYFISDDFYKKYDPDKKLMQNKESINGQTNDRPCFFAFQDRKQTDIYWLIPISSKIKKFEDI